MLVFLYLGSLVHQKPYLFLFAPSCYYLRCCPCLRVTSSRCLGSTSQSTFWRRILVHSGSPQRVFRIQHGQKFVPSRCRSALSEFEVRDLFSVIANRVSHPLHPHIFRPPPPPLPQNNRGNRSTTQDPVSCPRLKPTSQRLSAKFKNEAWLETSISPNISWRMGTPSAPKSEL